MSEQKRKPRPPQTGMTKRRAQAIIDAEDMRSTHERWLKHEDCERCLHEGLTDVVGDADHHRDCIARYDNIIACLRGEDRG